jgi:hypothetical protein
MEGSTTRSRSVLRHLLREGSCVSRAPLKTMPSKLIWGGAYVNTLPQTTLNRGTVGAAQSNELLSGFRSVHIYIY